MSDTLFSCKIEYPKDFAEMWVAFGASKNDSKAESFKAWEQTKRRRMSGGMFGRRAVECARLYNSWLDGENAHRRAKRQSDHPKLHCATWLRQSRWESYIEDADAIVQRTELSVADSGRFGGWENEAKTLIVELGSAKVESWMAGVVLKREANEVLFPTAFKASYVAVNFKATILRAFGKCALTVIGTSDRYEIE